MTLRILHLVHQYLPDYVGGTELYTRTLATELAQRGHANQLFTRISRAGSGVAEREDPGGVRVSTVWSGVVTPQSRLRATFGDRSITDAFVQAVADFRPTVVHVQHLMGLPAALLRHLQRINVPYVVTLHDYWWLCANAQLLTNDSAEICSGPNLWINCGRCALARADMPDRLWLAPAVAPVFAARHAWLRPLLQGAAALIAPTAFVRDLHSRMGIPAAKTTHIPHGIQLPDHLLPPQPPQAGRLRVAYVGGLSWQKGVHILVEALRGLDGVSLNLYGDETAFPDYVARCRQLAAGHPNIVFHGRIPHAQLWSELAQSDLVAVPTLWYETASLIVQEAFAARVPVVASGIGALKERVRDGVDGRWLPPGDVAAWRTALAEIRDQPDLRLQWQRNIAPVQTIDAHVTAVEAVYRQAQRPSLARS